MDNQNDKKEYELAYLVKDENQISAAAELVRSAGGEITNPGQANRTHLAYPIKQQTEVFFGSLQFALQPAKAKELEKNLQTDSRILRSLIVTPPPLKEKRRLGEPAAPTPRTREPREPHAVPLSNEALEKKIEEILQ